MMQAARVEDQRERFYRWLMQVLHQCLFRFVYLSLSSEYWRVFFSDILFLSAFFSYVCAINRVARAQKQPRDR